MNKKKEMATCIDCGTSFYKEDGYYIGNHDYVCLDCGEQMEEIERQLEKDELEEINE